MPIPSDQSQANRLRPKTFFHDAELDFLGQGHEWKGVAAICHFLRQANNALMAKYSH